MWLQIFSEIKIAIKALRILSKALALQNKKEYEKSIDCFKEGIAVAKQGSELTNYPLAILYYQIGYTYNKIDEYEKAYECLRKAERIFLDETGEYTTDLAENYAELGLAKSGVDDYISAIKYYQRSIIIYLELDLKNKLPLGWLYSNLGLCYRNRGRLDKANEYLNKAIEIYEQYKNEKSIVLRLKADVCLNNSDYPQALEYRKELLQHRLKKYKPDSSQVNQCYTYICEVYIKMGDEKNALEYLGKINHYKKENQNDGLIQVYAGLSRAYKTKENYERAIEFLKKSIFYAEENKDYSQIDLIEFLTELGSLYQRNNDIENAILTYNNATILLEKLPEKNRFFSFEIFYELAFLYEKKKDRIKANIFFKKLIQIYDENLWQDLPHIANACRIYGEVWLERKNYKKGIEYLEKAQTLHLKTVPQNEIKVIATTVSNFLNLSKAYRSQKNKKRALENLLSGFSAFINYTTYEESDLNKDWEEFEKDYLEKNKEFKSSREMNYYLYYYKQIKMNFIDIFFPHLKSISLSKQNYKQVIRFFHKLSKEKPRLSNWFDNKIERVRELERKL